MTEAPTSSPMCSQCKQRAAILTISDQPVCIACEHIFQQSRYMVFAQNAALMNHASDELDAVVGWGPRSPRVDIPKAPVPPIYYNSQSVTVHDSTIGTVNLGTARDIQANIESITENGDLGIADKLADLTNAILNSKDAECAGKNELLEQVAVLAQLAAAKPEERKPGAIKAIVSGITQGAGMIESIKNAWEAVVPLIRLHFKI